MAVSGRRIGHHKLVVCDSADEVSERTAVEIARRLSDRLVGRPKDRASVAFSGGSTPKPMFSRLAEISDNRGFDTRWDSVDIFQVDERVAPDRDGARNVVALDDNLVAKLSGLVAFYPIPIPADRSGDEASTPGTDSAADAAAEYAAVLNQVLGDDRRIDLIHLGLGADGHCASLIPGDPVLEVMDVDVAATGPYQGHRRVTMTYPLINRAGCVVWQVVGKSKSGALAGLLHGNLKLPASHVHVDDSIIIADQAAASKLG